MCISIYQRTGIDCVEKTYENNIFFTHNQVADRLVVNIQSNNQLEFMPGCFIDEVHENPLNSRKYVATQEAACHVHCGSLGIQFRLRIKSRATHSAAQHMPEVRLCAPLHRLACRCHNGYQCKLKDGRQVAKN
jgi:hypothetical protein